MPLVTTPVRPAIVTLVTPFILAFIFAPHLRTVISMDGGIVSLTLYDFYSGPDNGTRSIEKYFSTFLLYALMTVLLLLTPLVLSTPLLLIILFTIRINMSLILTHSPGFLREVLFI